LTLNEETINNNIENIQKAIWKIQEYLNDNHPVQASRALQRIQIYLGNIKETYNG